MLSTGEGTSSIKGWLPPCYSSNILSVLPRELRHCQTLRGVQEDRKTCGRSAAQLPGQGRTLSLSLWHGWGTPTHMDLCSVPASHTISDSMYCPTSFLHAKPEFQPLRMLLVGTDGDRKEPFLSPCRTALLW